MRADIIKRSNVSAYNNSPSSEEQATLFNKVLRGEISAIEGYRQVKEKFNDDPKISVIEGILNEHEDTVDDLKRHITFKPTDERPEEDSGIWGSFVATFLGTAKAMGETSTILALVEGEEHGLNQYMDLMENPSLSFNDKNLISTTFIPRQESHIKKLREILS